MVKVLTYPTLSPCQIDDFKPGAQRSVKGALHLKPSAVKVFTDDEWNHIQKHYKHLASKMKVVSEAKSQPAPASKKAAAPTTEEKPTVDETKKDEAKEDVEGKKPNGGGGGFKRKKVKPGNK